MKAGKKIKFGLKLNGLTFQCIKGLNCQVKGYWKCVLASPCVYCGNKVGSTKEHLIPRSMGGPDSWENVVGACPTCNKERGVQPFMIYFMEKGPKLNDHT